MSHRDPRFAGAVDGRIVALFLGWFVFCCVLTATVAWRVSNEAHAAGAILGILLGLTLSARERRRMALGCLLSGTTALTLLGATVGRPYVNLAGQAAPELAYLGYLDLERGRNERAAESYRQALELDPRQADWWYNLGVARLRLGNTEDAVEAFQPRLRTMLPRQNVLPGFSLRKPQFCVVETRKLLGI